MNCSFYRLKLYSYVHAENFAFHFRAVSLYAEKTFRIHNGL